MASDTIPAFALNEIGQNVNNASLGFREDNDAKKDNAMNAKTIRKNARQFCGCPNAGISCEKDLCKGACCVARKRYECYIAGYESCHTRLRKFASRVYSILGVKALNGCDDKTWDKFCNGNGTDVGNDMNSLVRTAQKLSK